MKHFWKHPASMMRVLTERLTSHYSDRDREFPRQVILSEPVKREKASVTRLYPSGEHYRTSPAMFHARLLMPTMQAKFDADHVRDTSVATRRHLSTPKKPAAPSGAAGKLHDQTRFTSTIPIPELTHATKFCARETGQRRPQRLDHEHAHPVRL